MGLKDRAVASWSEPCADAEIRTFKRGVVRGALRSSPPVDIDARTYLHPAWSSLHDGKCREALGAEAITRLVASLSTGTEELSEVFAWSLERQRARTAVKRGTTIDYAGGEDPAALDDVVNEAKLLLEDVWPEQAAAIRRLITHVIPFAARGEWSSSDMLTFGAVYYNPAFGRTPIDVAEALVHEAGHHALYIKQCLEPILMNPDTLCASPLRPDSRPVLALLHATFILRRLLEFYDRLGPRTSPAAAERLVRYRQNFAQGMETLRRRAEWTPWGARLFASLAE